MFSYRTDDTDSLSFTHDDDEETTDQENSCFSDSHNSFFNRSDDLLKADELRQKRRKRRRASEGSETPIQRHAANLRERRRMQSINQAFEVSVSLFLSHLISLSLLLCHLILTCSFLMFSKQGLRDHLPVLPYEKRLSKVDTLKHAINYIQILAELVSRDPSEAIKTPPPPPVKKFIVRSGHSSPEGFTQLHSLSWSFDTGLPIRGNVMTAKLWTPDDPRTSDSSLSSSVSSEERNFDDTTRFDCNHETQNNACYPYHEYSPQVRCHDILAECCAAIASNASE